MTTPAPLSVPALARWLVDEDPPHTITPHPIDASCVVLVVRGADRWWTQTLTHREASALYDAVVLIETVEDEDFDADDARSGVHTRDGNADDDGNGGDGA